MKQLFSFAETWAAKVSAHPLQPVGQYEMQKNEGILRDCWAKTFISTRNSLPPLKFHTGYLDLEVLNNQHNRCLHGHALVTKEVQGHKKRKKIWKEGDFFWVINWNFVNKVKISWKKVDVKNTKFLWPESSSERSSHWHERWVKRLDWCWSHVNYSSLKFQSVRPI